MNKFSNQDGKYEYNILPLEDATRNQWKTLFNLNDTMAANAENSYKRTMDLLGTGLAKCRSYLEQARQQRFDTANGAAA